MSAQIIPFPCSRRPGLSRHTAGSCKRCCALPESGVFHTRQVCDAELEALATQLRANGWTENDEDLPAHLRKLLRDGGAA